MATRPFIDKTAGTPPPPVNDRLLLAEELLELAEPAQAHTRAAGCALALKHGDKLFVRTSSGNAPEVGASLPLSDGAIGQCARLGKPLNITEEDKIDAVLRPLGVRSLIAVPIHHAGIFYGVAVVLGQTPDSFSRMHVAIVMTMGNEIARVLKRMEAVAVEIAPGSPLQSNTVAPAPVPANNVVTLELTPTARQNIVETIKTIEKKPEPTPTPVPMPMKLIIDPPAAATRTPLEVKTPVAAQSLASVTALPLETPAAPKPLPDLLPPGEDPRRYGTLKTAKSLEPKQTYVSAHA